MGVTLDDVLVLLVLTDVDPELDTEVLDVDVVDDDPVVATKHEQALRTLGSGKAVTKNGAVTVASSGAASSLGQKSAAWALKVPRAWSTVSWTQLAAVEAVEADVDVVDTVVRLPKQEQALLILGGMKELMKLGTETAPLAAVR